MPLMAAVLFLLPLIARGQYLEELDHVVFQPTTLPAAASPPPPRGDSRPSPLFVAPEALAGGAGPGVPGAEDGIARREAALRVLEGQVGPYGPELYDALLSLGEAHQVQNEHDEALSLFERAEHVSRVNRGLDNLQQVSSIRRQIESHIASGDLGQADEKYRYLAYLHEQQYGAKDLRLVPVMGELAQWHMDLFQRGIRFEASSGLDLLFNSRVPSEKGVRRSAFRRLYQAQGAYLKAINSLVQNREFTDPRLIDLEYRLIEAYFLQAYRDRLVDNPDNYLSTRHIRTGTRIRARGRRGYRSTYEYGEDAYQRILAYMANNAGTDPVDYARTLLEVGDWHLLFGRRVVGIRAYRDAIAWMREAELAPAEMRQLLAPDLPTVLPVFTPTPHSRALARPREQGRLEYQGYVDLAFALNKNGHARNLEVVASSPDTSRDVQHRLVHLVRKTQFRPRFAGLEPERDDILTLRYYYSLPE